MLRAQPAALPGPRAEVMAAPAPVVSHPAPDFTLLDSLDTPSLRKELVSGLRHFHFTTAGFEAAKTQPKIAEGVFRVAKETLAFAKRHTAGKGVQTGRWSEPGFSPARSEISAPSCPSSRHSKRLRTYWPKRSPLMPAASDASTSCRA